MMQASADIWSSHLGPGERIVWSASVSSALRTQDTLRRVSLYGLAGLASAVIAGVFATRLLHAVGPEATAMPLIAAMVPLYFVFALTMAALSLWGFRKAAARPPAATHFAATAQRLIALDKAGTVVAEMPAAEVDGVIAGGRKASPDIYVLRRHDPREERAFAIEHIARPLEAKAAIEQTFLEPAR
jgi:hypothetical protein